MEAKLSKLKEATAKAETEMKNAKEVFEDSEKRLNAAKELLKGMDPEDKKKIKVNDTKLPELLELHAIASEAYSVSRNRYETNMKYLSQIEDSIKKTEH